MSKDAVIYWVHIDAIAHIVGPEQRTLCGLDPGEQDTDPILDKRTYYACMDCITRWAADREDEERRMSLRRNFC